MSEYKPVITPNWLLGFIEGEGSFNVNKSTLLVVFTISQSSIDLHLMSLIKEYHPSPVTLRLLR